ncbi:hypothetical protein Tco_0400284 [Tanacetum coccineum]
MSSLTVIYSSVYFDSESWRFQWVFDDEPHPPSPDYVPGPEYREYVAPSDDEVPIEDQPLLAYASPTAQSSGYVADSNPSEEDPEEDPEEDHAEYPADRDNDDDDIEAFKTDKSAPTPPSPPTHTSPTYAEAPLGYRAAMIRSRAASPPPVPSPRLRRARISVRPQTQMVAATEALIAAIPSPSLPLPSPPLPLPAPSSPLLLPATDCRFEVGESSTATAARQPGLDVTHAADYSFIDTVDATPGRPISREVGYGITDVWDDMVGDMEERAPTTLEELIQRVTDLATTLVRDTHEMYVRFEDSQDDRALQRARVNTLFRDRRYLHTAMLLESEDRHTRQAWLHDIDCNRAVHAELLAYRVEGHDRTREPEAARDPEPQDGLTDAGSSC